MRLKDFTPSTSDNYVKDKYANLFLPEQGILYPSSKHLS